MSRILWILLALPLMAATGDVVGVRVVQNTCTAGASCNGWVAEIDLEGMATGGTYAFGLGTNNASLGTAKIVLTLTSPGYDTSGNTTTISRTVYGTQWLRKPYPNQAVADETAGAPLTVRVSLSDFVYSGDTGITVTIGAGFYTAGGTPNNAATSYSVTNNSTLAYPKPVGRWAWPGWEKITGDFLLESVVFHRFARNGKPLAALKYTCTDTSANSVTATVNDMTVSARTGDANKVLVYAATMSPTALTQGQVVTCNFVAYPWVGDSAAKLDSTPTTGDGFAQPDERLGPLLWVNDKTGAYGAAFAVVDPTNGNASAASTWVASSQATAEANYTSSTANSYTTIGYAIAAIKAYNNTNYSRNEAGGGTVLLATNANVMPGTGVATAGTMNTWLTITRLSTVTRANAAITSGTNANFNCQRLKLYDITISGSSTGTLRGEVTNTALWVDSAALNATGVPTWQLKSAYGTRNAVTSFGTGLGFVPYSTSHSGWALVRGNSFPTTSAGGGLVADQYAVLGNAGIKPVFYETGNTPGQQVSDNSIVAFNTMYNSNAVWVGNGAAISTVINAGFAFVQNVFERTGASGLAALQVAADNSTTNVQNVLIWHNTITGERINVGYNSSGSTALYRQNWSQRGNLFDNWNHKNDLFTTPDSGRTGSWPVGYGVGALANFERASTVNNADFMGLQNILGGTLGFKNDYSYNNGGGGSGAGNGDYHLTAASSALSLVLSGAAVLPYDLDGNPRRNDGTGAAGAYEFNGKRPVRVIIQ